LAVLDTVAKVLGIIISISTNLCHKFESTSPWFLY